MRLYTHTHTLIISLSEFLTKFKSKKFFNQEKNSKNLKNKEKSFNQEKCLVNQKNKFNQYDLKTNLKKEVLSFNSGVTLVALVITIIVLLILAGVTIALVVGDNGVLNQAVNAADETNRANVQTELEMAVSAVVADWSGARYVNGSNESLEDYMTKSRVEANMNTSDYNLKEFKLNTENGVTVGYKGKDYNFTVEITSSGNSAKVIYEGNSESSGGGEEGDNFADTVTDASHYGDYAEYNVDLNGDGDITNDWRIFYNNGENIFIIAADYVESSKVNLGATEMNRVADESGYSSYIYNLNWYNSGSFTLTNAGHSAMNETVTSMFMYNDYLVQNPTSANTNAKATTAMLNTAAWDNFKDSSGYAEYAVGGPTLEMWVASYNAKGYTPLYTNVNNTGYYIGNSEGTTDYYYYVTDDSNNGYGDTLYFPHQEIVSNCWGYWLASPSASYTYYVMYVGYDGRVGSSYYDYIRVGVRPLVSLKSEVTAVQNVETGVWELSI